MQLVAQPRRGDPGHVGPWRGRVEASLPARSGGRAPVGGLGTDVHLGRCRGARRQERLPGPVDDQLSAANGSWPSVSSPTSGCRKRLVSWVFRRMPRASHGLLNSSLPRGGSPSVSPSRGSSWSVPARHAVPVRVERASGRTEEDQPPQVRAVCAAHGRSARNQVRTCRTRGGSAERDRHRNGGGADPRGLSAGQPIGLPAHLSRSADQPALSDSPAARGAPAPGPPRRTTDPAPRTSSPTSSAASRWPSSPPAHRRRQRRTTVPAVGTPVHR